MRSEISFGAHPTSDHKNGIFYIKRLLNLTSGKEEKRDFKDFWLSQILISKIQLPVRAENMHIISVELFNANLSGIFVASDFGCPRLGELGCNACSF